MKYELEVGARTVTDALSAWYGGADRVELYVSPTEGALTPSAGLVRRMMKVKKAAGIGLGIFAMIRPRAGDALYTDEEFNVTSMSKEFGMSRTSLFSKIKALYGVSPQTWITDYRLNKAIELLKTHEFNVSEVSYKVGFSTLTGFSRSFKNKFGFPPSAV